MGCRKRLIPAGHAQHCSVEAWVQDEVAAEQQARLYVALFQAACHLGYNAGDDVTIICRPRRL